MGLQIQFEISLDFQDFHENLHAAHIAYLNPTDCLKMRTDHGFVPLVRAEGHFDEAVFVTHPETASPTLAAMSGVDVASVRSQIPTRIALNMLHSQGVQIGKLQDKESWLSVISSVWGNEVDFGILYRDTYEHLSDQGKSMIQVIATSDEQKAFHCLSVAPALADKQQEITQALLAMADDAQGKEVLAELDIPRWVPITDDELTTMQRLMEMEI